MQFKSDKQRKKVMMMLKGSKSSSIPYIVSGSAGIKGAVKCKVYNVRAKNKVTALKKSKRTANKNIRQFCNLDDLKISSKKFTPKRVKKDVNRLKDAGYDRMSEILSQLIYNKSFSKLDDYAQDVLGNELVKVFNEKDLEKFGRNKAISKKYDKKIKTLQQKFTKDIDEKFVVKEMDKKFYKKLVKAINEIDYDGTFESVIELAKSPASKREILKELEAAAKEANDAYDTILTDEADDAEYIRDISADKARFDKKYAEIVKMLHNKKFKY